MYRGNEERLAELVDDDLPPSLLHPTMRYRDAPTTRRLTLDVLFGTLNP